MITKPFSLHNKSININVPELNFEKSGVYKLCGTNGSGKTSLIRYLLKHDCVHTDENWRNDIAYFDQRHLKYDITVHEFLNCKYETHETVKWFEKFHLNTSVLNKNLNVLSGGERIKVHILRTIFLNKPIIIFDEPTNNLDDESVQLFNNILVELSKEHAVLLVSHDDRILDDFTVKYEIINNEIQVSTGSLNGQSIIANRKSDSFDYVRYNKKILRYLFTSKFNMQLLLILSLFVTLTVIGTNMFLSSILPTYPKFADNGYVELLNVYEPCGNIVDLTSKNACDTFDYLSVDDLNLIDSLDYVHTIYIVDEAYLNETYRNESISIVSIPNVISNSPNYKRSYPGTDGFVVLGRLPKDNTKEFVSSESVLRNDFGYSGDIKEAIGQSFNLNGETYKLTGISSIDYLTLSYSSSQQIYGVFEYSASNVERMFRELKVQGYEDPSINNLFIIFDERYNSDLMNEIAKTASSYQYSSNYINEMILNNTYNHQLPYVLAGAILISLIALIFMHFIILKSKDNVQNFLIDMNNLNFLPKANYRKLLGIIMIDFVIVSAIMLPIVNLFFNLIALRFLWIPIIIPYVFTILYLLFMVRTSND